LIYLCLATTGYGRYFKGLREFLSSQSFASKINVIGLEDRGVTGNFEITIKETGEVIHSKKHAGQGKADKQSERVAIAEQIQEYLDDL
jgi:hypothetical protein